MNCRRVDSLTQEPFRWGAVRGAAGRSCVALALALSLAVAPLAHAELSPVQKQEMKQLYERATRAYDVGKYNEAIEDYQKAYEIGGDPPMLYNIAQAYRLNDQPVEAVRFYRRYLQRAPGARNREDVERKIADLEKTIEERRKAAAAATPPPAVPPPVVPVAPPPPAPMVGPPAPAATPPPAPPPSATSAETVDTEPGPAPSEGGSTKKILGWSFLGAGALCGAGALAAGLVAKGKANDFANMSKMGAVYDPTVDHDGKAADHVAIGLGIAAGALVVTGGILLLTSSGSTSSESTSPESNPAPTPSAMLMPWLGNGLAGAGALVRY
jgi:tetratricopeptide (TPR) repeat protein